ncbi:hypothetical protein [Orientia tsutsugamushi]|uniref:Uncharacterized protein n=1 Tax=Orientia tsutsugamushi TaxID=784 RepID=A0A2U3RQL8_ORITS|nr:hypothetical protein OTSKARP_0290 [Orientia tsutsugamushi str. Karp]SPR15467.1 Uncharacterised protein [Orientia tsutsugamushi]
MNSAVLFFVIQAIAIQRLKFSFGATPCLFNIGNKAPPKGDQYIICRHLPASNIPGELKSPFH